MEDGELRLGVDLGGTATGGGIVVDGRLVAGPSGIAGEWGHNPLPWSRADELPGPACVFRPGGYRTGQGLLGYSSGVRGAAWLWAPG